MVEDELNFGTVLKAFLEMNDFEVEWVADGKNALPVFQRGEFDICILDVMLPHIDGFTIADGIRHINTDVPIVFLSAKVMKEDVLKGYKCGADDYITKPFDSDLLICKINAIMKRRTGDSKPKKETNLFSIGNYSFDFKLRTVEQGAKKQKLSPKEAQLLKMLCLRKNEVLPREEALISIWGEDNYFTTRSMDVYISKLRRYLKSDSNVEIVNIHGSGYRLSTV